MDETGTGQNSKAPLNHESPVTGQAFVSSDDVKIQSGAGQSAAVTWTAAEFIHHEKRFSWYLGVILIGFLLAVGAYFLTKDLLTAIVIVVCGLAFSYYGSHKPRQLSYALDNSSLTVGQKHFPLGGFRSFFIVRDKDFSALTFIPHKRFGLATTIHVSGSDEPKVLNFLADRLPEEPIRKDPIDSLMRKVRF